MKRQVYFTFYTSTWLPCFYRVDWCCGWGGRGRIPLRRCVFWIASETHCILLSLDNDVRKVGSLAGSSVLRMYLSNPSLILPAVVLPQPTLGTWTEHSAWARANTNAGSLFVCSARNTAFCQVPTDHRGLSFCVSGMFSAASLLKCKWRMTGEGGCEGRHLLLSPARECRQVVCVLCWRFSLSFAAVIIHPLSFTC